MAPQFATLLASYGTEAKAGLLKSPIVRVEFGGFQVKLMTLFELAATVAKQQLPSLGWSCPSRGRAKFTLLS